MSTPSTLERRTNVPPPPPVAVRWFKSAVAKELKRVVKAASTTNAPLHVAVGGLAPAAISAAPSSTGKSGSLSSLASAVQQPLDTLVVPASSASKSPALSVATAVAPATADSQQAALITSTAVSSTGTAVVSPVKNAQAMQWSALGSEESAVLEAAYTTFRSQIAPSNAAGKHEFHRTLVSEASSSAARKAPSVTRQWGKVTIRDLLYEVDIKEREVYPIYWQGAVFPVTRATWFLYESGAKQWLPADETLAAQIEDGYLKHQPWAQFIDVPDGVDDPEAQAKNRALLNQVDKLRWSLFGPYRDNYVLYTGTAQAWLLNDNITSKITMALYSRLSSGENLGGIRLVRGYDNMEKAMARMAGPLPPRRPLEHVDDPYFAGQAMDALPVLEPERSTETTPMSEKPHLLTAEDLSTPGGTAKPPPLPAPPKQPKPPPKIKHLVLCVHGVGQKYTLEKNPAFGSFVDDVRDLRQMVQAARANIIQQQQQKAAAATNPSLNTSPAAQKLSTSGDASADIPATAPSSAKAPALDKSSSSPKLPAPIETGSVTPSVDAPDEIMVLPVEWRTKLKFDRPGDAASGLGTQDITLDGIPAFRAIISHILLDVLLYMAPAHRDDMVQAVVNEMNRIYHLFMERHPLFFEEGGKIHIMGHSLGSIVMLDVLCRHNFTKFQLQQQQAAAAAAGLSADALGDSTDLSELNLTNARDHHGGSRDGRRHGRRGSISTATHIIECLQFPVEKFFAVGSPIALFELLKSSKLGVPLKVMREYIEDWIVEFNKREGIMDSSEVRGLDVGRLISKLIQDEQVLHPDLQAFYSVFHPNDPVAYRIEPLVSKSLSAQKPSPVPYTKGGLTGLGVNISELASRATGDITGLFGSLRTSLVSTIAFKRAMLEVDSSKDGDGEGDSGDDEMRTPEEHDGVFTTSSSPRTPMLRGSGSLSRLHQPPAPKFTTEEILASLNRKRRLDYVLQESLIENPYLSALAVHFGYWKDADYATFMLREILEMSGV